MQVGIIGLGHMGSAIARGLVRADVPVIGKSSTAAKAKQQAQDLGVEVVVDTTDFLAKQPQVVILTTPVPTVISVMTDLVEHDLPKDTIVLSAAAGVSLADLKSAAPKNPLASFVPNIPVAVNAGTSALSLNDTLGEQDQTTIQDLLGKLGDVIEVPAQQLGLAGTVGGCGPAFVDVFMDALEDAAVAEGMSRLVAKQVIASMVAGSAKLAQDSPASFADLKGQVTSPGGSTIQGVLALEKNNFRQAAIAAVLAANGKY
ncbi:pyrroline-5-carboxylate reductase [Leuconostocaceae bacterium ESL0723]|nr:pyrroline-5-carboxylate reductase [Leuconostocaceae bacterium ESL0723]